jgi:hypothetical protein
LSNKLFDTGFSRGPSNLTLRSFGTEARQNLRDFSSKGPIMAGNYWARANPQFRLS